jgi:hypothetical protein
MHTTKYNSLSQLAAVMAGFAITILLLESGALLTWADRLDGGPARSGAVRVTAALDKALQPLGVEQVRKESLDGLDRLGWTDDPARLLAAREKYSRETQGSCTAKAQPPSPAAPTVAAQIVASVPKLTPLKPLPPAAPGQTRLVALVGDSMMAVGLSDVLLRETATDKDVRVVKAFRSGTGLARPDVFDWMQEYPAMIGDEKPDAVIVAIGANDGQGFWADGNPLLYGTDAWVKAYQQRTADFLNLLTQNGAHVVWVGLPPMKSGTLNNKTAEINRIAYTVVSQNPLATWWNPQSLIGDEAGGFRETETLPDGKITRIRVGDGVHLTDEGAALLAPSLLGWLNFAGLNPTAPSVATAQVTPQEAPQVQVGRHRHGARGRAARPGARTRESARTRVG